MEPEKKETQENPILRLLPVVMTAVFIICGGNGAGIVLGVLRWKRTGEALPALALFAGCTLAAVAVGVLVVLLWRRRRK